MGGKMHEEYCVYSKSAWRTVCEHRMTFPDELSGDNTHLFSKTNT